MGTDILHTIAQNDTPAAVEVPKSLNGLIVWAVGRFGGGILLAGACFWMLTRVYEDHAKQTDRMMMLMEARASSDSQLATAMLSVKLSIEEMTKEARAAHRGGQ